MPAVLRVLPDRVVQHIQLVNKQKPKRIVRVLKELSIYETEEDLPNRKFNESEDAKSRVISGER